LLTGADPTASASEATPLRRAAKQKTLFIIAHEKRAESHPAGRHRRAPPRPADEMHQAR
jgi:hypothetical protein